MTIIDDTAHRGARLVADLTAAGIKVPKPVAAAAATRDTLATATRAVPRADVLAAELVDALTADPGANHTMLAVSVAAAPALLAAVRRACEGLTLKVILESGELQDPALLAQALLAWARNRSMNCSAFSRSRARFLARFSSSTSSSTRCFR